MKDFFEGAETHAHPWPAGRRDLHWHLLPPRTEETTDALLGPYTGLLRTPGMEMVMPDWLHVTVLRAGPHDQASEGEIAEMTDRVREAVAGTGPVELVFSRSSVGTVGIARAGWPRAAAHALHRAAWSVTRQVVGDRWWLAPAIFHPHLTLAYAGRDAEQADRDDMKNMLSRVDAGEATVSFPTLTLVSQWHTHQEILWEVLATIPLG